MGTILSFSSRRPNRAKPRREPAGPAEILIFSGASIDRPRPEAPGVDTLDVAAGRDVPTAKPVAGV